MVGWGERLSTVYRGETVQPGTVLRKIGKKDEVMVLQIDLRKMGHYSNDILKLKL